MGCDIHGFLEIRNQDEVWEAKDRIPDDRDYDWFGILAGVRNYTNTRPIAEPRGIPFGVSDEVKEKIDSWGMDGHSHSWLTYKDISEHDWDYASVDGRKSTIDRKTGEELGKASFSSRWDTQLDKFEYKHLPRIAKDLVSESWKLFLNNMALLAVRYGSENVRIVFWFDC